MENFHKPIRDTKFGMHYFSDTTHFRDEDLAAWLPELKAIGASWLTLKAPLTRAIPEKFVRGLIDSGIEPILQFQMLPDSAPKPNELAAILEAYAHWGIHYISLFDRPNLRQMWPGTSWAQSDLVERFLDIYLPLADLLIDIGVTPIFPPLEPGGDYWDTAFLRSSLQVISNRGKMQLLDKLVLGAYAWVDSKPLNWGAGGPERWPGARPYYTPPEEEDQCGFRIFDWYSTISAAVLGEPLPIILMAIRCSAGEDIDPREADSFLNSHAERNLRIASLMADNPASRLVSDEVEEVPDNVLACNFWLLSANADSPHAFEAWYQPDGTNKPIIGALKDWMADQFSSVQEEKKGNVGESPPINSPVAFDRSIKHYLLLPSYEWGVADWHLDVIRPFVKRHQPTVGYSISEAKGAQRVTVVGGEKTFSQELIIDLQEAGCEVSHIQGDGTNIATQLAEL
ncbi:MAG: hypothetical protein FVQ83_02570 [Chloroflexi bacterium]|nr:hypothetical protein [Chloroflexota bacterium]